MILLRASTTIGHRGLLIIVAGKKVRSYAINHAKDRSIQDELNIE